MSTIWNAESLTQRIRNKAALQGIPAARLRNHVAFQRILARLARRPEWILKGGFCLEVRLGLDARATKDLDLLKFDVHSASGIELQDQLDEALSTDLGDGFTFLVRAPKPVRAEEAEPGAWRVSIEVRYGGQEFGITAVDVVRRSPNLSMDAEPVKIEATLVGDDFTMPALDPHRHAAEKYHAYIRSYAWDRPSSRVKDLVDLVLLCESGILTPRELGESLDQVFEERATELPDSLPPPPPDWKTTYPPLANETSAGETNVEAAWKLSASWYRRARDASTSDRRKSNV